MTTTTILPQAIAFCALALLLVSVPAQKLGNGEQGGGRVEGYIRDGETKDKPISEATIEFRIPGEDEPFHTQKTNSQGYYLSPRLKARNYSIRVVKSGYTTARFPGVKVRVSETTVNDANLLVPGKAKGFRVTLSWCKQKDGAVKDVDTYLSIPGVQRPLYFGNKNRDYHGTHLDVDDVSWEGPETTTIGKPRAGTYVYYVNNYNVRGDRKALGNSTVQVFLYQDDKHIRTYRIKPGTGITYEVFRIVDGKVQDVEKWNDRLALDGR